MEFILSPENVGFTQEKRSLTTDRSKTHRGIRGNEAVLPERIKEKTGIPEKDFRKRDWSEERYTGLFLSPRAVRGGCGSSCSPYFRRGCKPAI